MRLLRGLAAGAVVGFAVVAAPWAGAVSAQTLPPLPVVPVPAPPAEAQPVRDAASPVGWTACGAAATGSFLLVFAGGAAPGLLPVPVPVALPISPIAAIHVANTALNPAFGACGLLGAPVPVPHCTADAQAASAPFVGQRPAGVAVNQVAAIEQAAGAGGTVSGPLAAGLGCNPSTDTGLPDLPDVDAVPAGSAADTPATAGPDAEVLSGLIAAGGVTTMPAAAAGAAVAGGGTAGPAGGIEQATAAIGSAARWTPLRMVAVGLVGALGIALVIRWLTFTPVAPRP